MNDTKDTMKPSLILFYKCHYENKERPLRETRALEHFKTKHETTNIPTKILPNSQGMGSTDRHLSQVIKEM